MGCTTKYQQRNVDVTTHVKLQTENGIAGVFIRSLKKWQLRYTINLQILKLRILPFHGIFKSQKFHKKGSREPRTTMKNNVQDTKLPPAK